MRIIYSHYMMLLGRNILHTYISTVSKHKKLIEINPNNYKVSVNYLSKYMPLLCSLYYFITWLKRAQSQYNLKDLGHSMLEVVHSFIISDMASLC